MKSALNLKDYIIKILEYLVDNIFVVFVGKIVGFPMGANCTLSKPTYFCTHMKFN